MYLKGQLCIRILVPITLMDPGKQTTTGRRVERSEGMYMKIPFAWVSLLQ